MWDLFISHASEDKSDFVKPLAIWLNRLGVKVWYDEFELKAGDSLSRSIDKGLRDSYFGVVVLSPSFFKKGWPEYELRGLVAKEVGRDKVIIPVWWRVTREEVLSYSPWLADKVAVNAIESSLPMVVTMIIKVIKPELYNTLISNHIMSTMYGLNDVINAPPSNSPEALEIASGFAEGKFGMLPQSAINRISLISHFFYDNMLLSTNEWISFIKHEWPIELKVWERIGACIVEFNRKHPLTSDQMKILLQLLVKSSLEKDLEDRIGLISGMSDQERINLIEIWKETDPEKEGLEMFPNHIDKEIERNYIDRLRKAFMNVLPNENNENKESGE